MAADDAMQTCWMVSGVMGHANVRLEGWRVVVPAYLRLLWVEEDAERVSDMFRQVHHATKTDKPYTKLYGVGHWSIAFFVGSKSPWSTCDGQVENVFDAGSSMTKLQSFPFPTIDNGKTMIQ